MSSSERCYLCNCAFVDNKVYEHMFEKRFNVSNNEQDTLASILETVLAKKLHHNQVHSTFVCSTCKVSLLNYEAMSQQLLQLRSEILEMHKQTIQLLKSKVIKFNDDHDDELREQRSSGDADLEQPADLILMEPSSLDDELELMESCSENIDDWERNSSIINADVVPKEVNPPKKRRGRKARALQLQFQCSYCDKICNRRNGLLEHERTHTGERPFECEECGACFAQRSNWLSHRKTTHLNLANFKCNQCERQFKRRRLLENHIKSVHTKVRDLSCDQCDATFGNAINLKKHQSCHTGDKNYSCQICGKQFRCAENRNVHHFVHSIRKPYVCVICNEGFMRKQQLITHSKVQNHSNPKIVRLQPQFSAANSDKLLQRLYSAATTK